MNPVMQGETFEQLSKPGSNLPPWFWDNWPKHDIFPGHPPFLPAIPEPSVWLMLLAGIIVIIAIVNNKLRKD